MYVFGFIRIIDHISLTKYIILNNDMNIIFN